MQRNHRDREVTAPLTVLEKLARRQRRSLVRDAVAGVVLAALVGLQVGALSGRTEAAANDQRVATGQLADHATPDSPVLCTPESLSRKC